MRVVGEWVLRATAVAALGAVSWRWSQPVVERAPVVESIDVRADSALGSALRRWTTGAATPAAHVALAGAPGTETRAWLRALSRAGMHVGWSAQGAAPIAVSAEATPDPAGGIRLDVAGPDGAVIAVGDAIAAADTARLHGAGASMLMPAASDTLIARAGATTARVAAPAATRLGAILVLGRAGWEAKFVAAALEERGWPVQVRLVVAPGIDVTGTGMAADGPLAPDTATTAAVVVLDSVAVDAAGAAAIGRFVRAGGGVVLAGDAAAAPSLQPLATGRVGAPIIATPGAIDGVTPRRGLALMPIDALRSDAIVLERRDGGSGAVSVAARRIGRGRAAQVGYLETWRWRMAARDEAPAAHRAWWSRVVGAVAYAPVPPIAGSPDPFGAHPADPAPYAETIAALGAPTAAPAPPRGGIPVGRWPSDGMLAALAGAALLGEVASRRMRGAR
jgi:hypothetical protein